MPRIYTVSFENVAVSAAQDLVQLIGASGKILRVLRVWAGATDSTIPTSQMLRTQCRYLPATVTNGSGGSAPTPAALDPGDAAASFTAKANSTSQASTGGTADVLMTRGEHLYNGVDFRFDHPPAIGGGESFTFELLSTVSGTVHLSGGAEVEESGG